jgi:hypothetical protein
VSYTLRGRIDSRLLASVLTRELVREQRLVSLRIIGDGVVALLRGVVDYLPVSATSRDAWRELVTRRWLWLRQTISYKAFEEALHRLFEGGMAWVFRKCRTLTPTTALLVIVGAVAALSLPTAQFPNIAPPEVQVKATYVGADAQTVEQSVATPIEQQMSGVDNMNYMYSLNATANGGMRMIVNFDVNAGNGARVGPVCGEPVAARLEHARGSRSREHTELRFVPEPRWRSARRGLVASGSTSLA